MIVTDKQYSMEKKLIEKLNLICDRCSGKHDALLICDGDEGFGKTTLSGNVGYYVAYKLNRPFSVDNFFFNLDEMIKFAINNEKQVIIWDEAALGGLAAEWNTPTQKKLMKMLMVARKKKHFYIFNIPRFFKLNEYIIVDRAIGLIHVYSRDGKTMGRFTYYKNNNFEKLFYDWKRSRKRNYKMYYNVSGTFPDALKKIININEYERRKDKAIMDITEVKKEFSKKDEKLRELQHKISTLEGIKQIDKAKHFKVTRKTLYEWGKSLPKSPDLLVNQGL